MRLFIAINFSDETRARLQILRDELRSRSERGRFSAPENLHLTLAFLGECDAKQAATAKTAVDNTNFAPFMIGIDRVGRFKRDGGDIWWAGVQVSQKLLRLHSDLTDKLITAGFRLEKRKYSPHITLGREIVTDAVPWQVEPFGESVECVELMKSERIDGKLTYTVIHGRESV